MELEAETPLSAAPDHRRRLLEGMAAAIAEHGYAATRLADVVAHARVSRRTFYEHFEDKEACFLALYVALCDHLLEVIATPPRRRSGGTSGWARRSAPTSPCSPRSRR
jgi:AcrR family transcriptional regulator